MVIVELLLNGIVSILIAYLSLTNALAEGILAVLPQSGEYREVTQHETNSDAGETELEVSDGASRYETGGPIPQILLENSEYQEAAVGSSTFEEGETENAVELPLEERIESALVNIYCQYKTGEYLKTTAGSGFFIQNNGVVLTNAHVAQFLLLEHSTDEVRDAECTLRAGNPAKPMYRAELLYISPLWVFGNAALLQEEHPQGTGERDYALLYVSESIDGSALPPSFPSLPIDTGLLTKETRDTSVFTAGYPAEILFTEGADAKLIPKIARTTVQELYTFGSNYADLFAVSGSEVGEQGSSGGPITTENGSVIGMITTKGMRESDGAQSLRAITLSYIDRTITEETGFTLIENMRGDLAFRGSVFKRVLVPFLSDLLTTEMSVH